MKVMPLTSKSEIAAAFKLLRTRLVSDAVPLRRTIGFPGGHVEALLHWRATEEMWLHFNASNIENRYWCCYGVRDPSREHDLDIAVEINPPKEGFDRRIAGAFVVEPGGRVFLAHSGKIGGGKKGVGKDAFWNFYLGPTSATVSWPDREETEVILIGEVRDPRLPQQIAAFVHEVARFKMAVASGSLASPLAAPRDAFSPEFEGTKTFNVNTVIESSCDHGPVVRSLKEALEALSIPAANDRLRDLYTLRPSGDMNTLFEVKTSLNAIDIYTGVGQLMIHGARQGKAPKRVLVLPRGLGRQQLDVLSLLGIAVLDYTWQSKQPSFPKLAAVVGSK